MPKTMEMTEAETILKMVEEVDPADTPTPDGIDAAVNHELTRLKRMAKEAMEEYDERIKKGGPYGVHGAEHDAVVDNFVKACIALHKSNAIAECIESLKP